MEEKAAKTRKRSIGTVLMCLLLAAALVVNILCGVFNGIISQYFNKPRFDKNLVQSTAANSHSVSQLISEESMVLLKNDNSGLPLDMSNERETKVNLFGLASVDPFYTPESSAQGNKLDAVTIPEGLANAGITANPDLTQFYYDSEYKNESSTVFGNFTIDYVKKQVPLNEYPDDLWTSSREYSDVAIICLNRYGAEGFEDIPVSMAEYGGREDENYLELSDIEIELIEKVKSLNFDKNIVVLNTGNPMELGFLEEDWIDSALWIGYGGQDGMNALGRILSGDVNPSGHLTDTYAYDSMSSPAYQLYGDYKYINTLSPDEWAMTGERTPYGFMNYSEGIYVGYRYYETRFVDNETGEMDEEAYREVVQYPFGYGLSYTTFEQELLDVTQSDSNIQVKVKVTNTGDTAGKEVVEIYYTPPYYVGGIEKSFVNLVAFDKTELLDPGASEEINLTFTLEDMASFDYMTEGCYVLDQGDYEIKLMKNAHDMIDSRIVTVPEKVVYGEDNKRDTDLIAAVSRFKAYEGEQTFLSRADWEGTWPAEGEHEVEADQWIIDELLNYEPEEDPDAEDIVLKDNGLKLADLKGAAYDDPKWDLLMEQVPVNEMMDLIAFGGYQTLAMKSVEKPYTVDLNGPGGIFSLINETTYESVGIPMGSLIACSWNEDLIELLGDALGQEANAWEVSGLYAPSMNLHRHPYNGRAAEYYSEDPFMTGKCAAALIRGVQANNVYCYMKHMGLYDQAVNTEIMCTWFNEQGLREIHLKGFEMAVKEADAHAVMVCYNKLGPVWTGGCKEMMTDVLRGEWGFQGFSISDGMFAPYNSNAPVDRGLRAGNDIMLNSLGCYPEDSGPIARQNMRRATKNVLFSVVNSNGMDIGNYGPSNTWKIALAICDVIIAALAVFYFVRRKKKA